MTSYKELLMQREALEQQINEARRNELANAVSQVRALVAEYGLTARDIFPTSKFLSGGRIPGARASRGTKVAPKYREPATGQTWTGRGKAPKWIQNEDRAKFAI
ncbi:H-NS histone family protein [Verminephrobacter eiseniae]|uniref:H-NS histone family protein n=1 Tax=Verminephrobacter eiseniae TaxID=364317 RepID=UPI00030B317B|nr:H-NS histone family protein [Verminephrobacter eiseniae]KAB7627430.1 H-NS histone family protein [Verminephrobacter sp. Larva24]MCW5234180.1 H-NS histone family protein [Verminephrobacter eiseniae]MCW5236149.1 H-NS histone family protein [Verminephrobacter eiseniae]MCW5262304.1 H-NS histone family protein [Verminephrobacter eiseniae]MCW5287443.1 H-NS histone family protein [Verminephrobacter eiseniae]